MSRNVPDDLFVRVDKLLGDEPFWKLAEIIYNRGAQDALERLRDQATFRAENVVVDGDSFRYGKLAGYEWAMEATQLLIEECKEE